LYFIPVEKEYFVATTLFPVGLLCVPVVDLKYFLESYFTTMPRGVPKLPSLSKIVPATFLYTMSLPLVAYSTTKYFG
jgi:hypothetical protein